MRILSISTLTAGVLASIAVIVFMNIIPPILGLGITDITRDLGLAFSSNSPHVAGGIFLAMMGMLWATVFSAVQSNLPGNYLMKGSIYGLFVGVFSLVVLPMVMTTLDGIFGAPNQYIVTQFSMNSQALASVIAYVVFGVVLAITTRPSEASGSL